MLFRVEKAREKTAGSEDVSSVLDSLIPGTSAAMASAAEAIAGAAERVVDSLPEDVADSLEDIYESFLFG